MNKRIANLLQKEYGYSEQAATQAAVNLLSIQDDELRQALMKWLALRSATNISEGDINTQMLCERGYTYPAALIMIDMLRTSPEEARYILKGKR